MEMTPAFTPGMMYADSNGELWMTANDGTSIKLGCGAVDEVDDYLCSMFEDSMFDVYYEAAQCRF